MVKNQAGKLTAEIQELVTQIAGTTFYQLISTIYEIIYNDETGKVSNILNRKYGAI